MGMFLALNIDALPTELFDCYECLVYVIVFGDQICPQVQRKALGIQNVWVCEAKNTARSDWCSEAHESIEQR